MWWTSFMSMTIALFGGEEIADFGAELRGVVGGEFAVAFDDDGVVGAIGVDAEVGRGVVCVRMLVRFGGGGRRTRCGSLEGECARL